MFFLVVFVLCYVDVFCVVFIIVVFPFCVCSTKRCVLGVSCVLGYVGFTGVAYFDLCVRC